MRPGVATAMRTPLTDGCIYEGNVVTFKDSLAAASCSSRQQLVFRPLVEPLRWLQVRATDSFRSFHWLAPLSLGTAAAPSPSCDSCLQVPT